MDRQPRKFHVILWILVSLGIVAPFLGVMAVHYMLAQMIGGCLVM